VFHCSQRYGVHPLFLHLRVFRHELSHLEATASPVPPFWMGRHVAVCTHGHPRRHAPVLICGFCESFLFPLAYFTHCSPSVADLGGLLGISLTLTIRVAYFISSLIIVYANTAQKTTFFRPVTLDWMCFRGKTAFTAS
jgi:hypothetical protein